MDSCILNANIPRWSFLSWSWYPSLLPPNNVPNIILNIHKSIIPQLDRKISDSSIIVDYNGDLELPEFKDNFNGDIGFGGCLERAGQQGDFVTFFAPLPATYKYSEEKCHRCHGTGKEYGDLSCGSCNGAGKEYDIDDREADILSTSFTMLFNLMTHDNTIPYAFPQLIEILTVTKSGPHGSSISGYQSIAVSNWLKKLTKKKIAILEGNIIKAMMSAYDRLRAPEDESSFKAKIWNGGFNIACPGNSCGVDVENEMSEDNNYGKRLHSHNVDRPPEQLTLLIGLAALCDYYRADQEKPPER